MFVLFNTLNVYHSYSSVHALISYRFQDGHQYANTGFQRSVQSIASAPASAEAAGGAEDVPQYSTIQPHGSSETAGGAEDDVQYSTIQPHGSRETAGGAEDVPQYSTIQPHGSRETAGGAEDDVHYSTIWPMAPERLQELRGTTSNKTLLQKGMYLLYFNNDE